MTDAPHPDIDELAAYVQDLLAGERSAEIERHVARCPGCARRLRSEARLEVALHQAATMSRRCRRRKVAWSAAIANIAAALFVWLSVGEQAISVAPVSEHAPERARGQTATDSCEPELDGVYCSQDGATMVAAERTWSNLAGGDAAPLWSSEPGDEAMCSEALFTPLDADQTG
jgi:anti-sigma factor RsiW